MAKFRIIYLVINPAQNSYARVLECPSRTTVVQAKRKAASIISKLPGDLLQLTLYRDNRVILKRTSKYTSRV